MFKVRKLLEILCLHLNKLVLFFCVFGDTVVIYNYKYSYLESTLIEINYGNIFSYKNIFPNLRWLQIFIITVTEFFSFISCVP